MLFALLDYLAYRRQLGRYSPKSLTSQGWRLAIAENFEGQQAPEPGDVFVQHTRTDARSWLIMYFGNSAASHVGIVSYGGKVEATPAGVIETPWSSIYDSESYLLIHHPDATIEQRHKIVQTAHSMIGRGYNWAGLPAMALREVMGARHRRTNPRLYADTVLCLTVAGLAGKRIRHWQTFWMTLSGAYVGAVIRNRIRNTARETARAQAGGPAK